MCIDTTLASELEEYRRYFEAPKHRRFLDEAFPSKGPRTIELRTTLDPGRRW